MGQPPAQFNNGLASHPPQQLNTKYGQPPAQAQPPVGYTYENYQTPGTSSKPPSAHSAHPGSKPASMASSPTATPRSREYVTDTDTTMEDADPYNRAKYPSRPTHHSRASSQFLSQAEESSAARRYSPMNVLSPPMSYPTSPGKPPGTYDSSPSASAQARRSPARAVNYTSPPQSYQSPPGERLPIDQCNRIGPPLSLCCCLHFFLLSSAAGRVPRLPPLQPGDLNTDHFPLSSTSSHVSPTYGAGPREPRSAAAPAPYPGRGPVPKFQKIKTVQELQPRIHTQPAYRRANPEGGFISVRVASNWKCLEGNH